MRQAVRQKPFIYSEAKRNQKGNRSYNEVQWCYQEDDKAKLTSHHLALRYHQLQQRMYSGITQRVCPSAYGDRRKDTEKISTRQTSSATPAKSDYILTAWYLTDSESFFTLQESETLEEESVTFQLQRPVINLTCCKRGKAAMQSINHTLKPEFHASATQKYTHTHTQLQDIPLSIPRCVFHQLRMRIWHFVQVYLQFIDKIF